MDELAVAGALAGAPVELTDCRTVAAECVAHAEYVIEGELLGELAPENPQGPYATPEFLGYQGRAHPALPSVRVTAITDREGAIFQTVSGPGHEQSVLLGFGMESAVLARLRELGVRVVVAGNGTAKAGELLRALDLPADLVATSGEWGVAPPDPEFFARVLDASGADPRATLYVGAHPARGLFPAKSSGLRAAHIRRGAAGYWWADHPDVVETADFHVSALTELPGLVEGAGPAEPPEPTEEAPGRTRVRALRAL
ncbi:hypothetical protein E6R62_37505 [Streptomyces sp. A1136]|nr:hypothetical protein E6R62_37505 [Streptomyces sp. A1136]